MIDKKILLLSCCAPCFCSVLEKLLEDKADVTVVFYNPNIAPFDEYKKRMEENKALCKEFGVPFVELEYDNDRWLSLTKDFADEPERGKRCDVCFYMRIRRVMEYARDNGFEAVASVLGVSRHKDNEQVKAAAQKASSEMEVLYVDVEYRKDGAVDLIQKFGLYRQKYCGCVFSARK